MITELCNTPTGVPLHVPPVEPNPQTARFECGGCGRPFVSFKEAAAHSWIADECQGLAQ